MNTAGATALALVSLVVVLMLGHWDAGPGFSFRRARAAGDARAADGKKSRPEPPACVASADVEAGAAQ